MSNLSILIVEDEAIVAEDLANKVRQLGYNVAGTAMSGEEAVELARQQRPALVLMDICLAGVMDGIAAAQEIYNVQKLPVLFLTAHSDTDTVERARQTEAFGYILKPFDKRDLRIQIEMALYKHTAERRLHESKEQLAGINQILQAALTCVTEEELGEACLDIAKKITQSPFGFIGKINNDELEHLSICTTTRNTCTILAPSGHATPPGNVKIHGIYGRVIRDGKSLFTNDPANHPHSIGLPKNHIPLTSFLGAPLLHEGCVIGLLAMGNRENGYTQVEQNALEAMAPSIVEAFARKRAEEHLQKSAAELQASNAKLLDSNEATINIMQEAVTARLQAEKTSVALQHEIVIRQQAEDALLAFNNELEQRVEQRTLELQNTQKQFLHAEKLSAIGKLSASIAHEFNNPLQGIIAVLKGLRRRAVLEPDDKELLDEAIDEGDRIKELIRSLQEFNRPSTGRKNLMDLHKALDAVLLLYKSDFIGKRISLVLDYAERLPQVHAVADQIKQVFLNMITNAADACHQRGGVITIKTWQENEGTVAVAIQDNGAGIKRSDIDLIFQPFFTTKPSIKGTGLGLSICHGIIKTHQGEIRVESQPGEGSTFTILLPIKGTEIDP